MFVQYVDEVAQETQGTQGRAYARTHERMDACAVFLCCSVSYEVSMRVYGGEWFVFFKGVISPLSIIIGIGRGGVLMEGMLVVGVCVVCMDIVMYVCWWYLGLYTAKMYQKPACIGMYTLLPISLSFHLIDQYIQKHLFQYSHFF